MSEVLNIRPERPDDAAAVRALLDAAFGGDTESQVVERLRADGDFVLSLVAENGEGIAGYVGFPRLVLRLDERNVPVAGLAPVGVSPPLQRRGIGGALIRDGVARLKDRAERLVFVLGDPAYYGRFGFTVMEGFLSPYAGPYFQALLLAPDAPKAGRVSYPRAFDGL
ncbi:MAG: N-acetyltransferase [Xanthobacteraceae bacterium]|nr:N-acetyltransferase [Xanthobacteraceae bacterium]